MFKILSTDFYSFSFRIRAEAMEITSIIMNSSNSSLNCILRYKFIAKVGILNNVLCMSHHDVRCCKVI